jgi:hypothetical protein
MKRTPSYTLQTLYNDKPSIYADAIFLKRRTSSYIQEREAAVDGIL